MGSVSNKFILEFLVILSSFGKTVDGVFLRTLRSKRGPIPVQILVQALLGASSVPRD